MATAPGAVEGDDTAPVADVVDASPSSLTSTTAANCCGCGGPDPALCVTCFGETSCVQSFDVPDFLGFDYNLGPGQTVRFGDFPNYLHSYIAPSVSLVPCPTPPASAIRLEQFNPAIDFTCTDGILTVTVGGYVRHICCNNLAPFGFELVRYRGYHDMTSCPEEIVVPLTEFYSEVLGPSQVPSCTNFEVGGISSEGVGSYGYVRIRPNSTCPPGGVGLGGSALVSGGEGVEMLSASQPEKPTFYAKPPTPTSYRPSLRKGCGCGKPRPVDNHYRKNWQQRAGDYLRQKHAPK